MAIDVGVEINAVICLNWYIVYLHLEATDDGTNVQLAYAKYNVCLCSKVNIFLISVCILMKNIVSAFRYCMHDLHIYSQLIFCDQVYYVVSSLRERGKWREVV